MEFPYTFSALKYPKCGLEKCTAQRAEDLLVAALFHYMLLCPSIHEDYQAPPQIYKANVWFKSRLISRINISRDGRRGSQSACLYEGIAGKKLSCAD
jgi:hypothetical protein